MKALRPLFLLLLLTSLAPADDGRDRDRDFKTIVSTVKQGMRKIRLTEKKLRPQHDFIPGDPWRLPIVNSYLNAPLKVAQDAVGRFGGLVGPDQGVGITAALRTAGVTLGYAGTHGRAAVRPVAVEAALLELYTLVEGSDPPSAESLTKQLSVVPAKVRKHLAALVVDVVHVVKERQGAFEKISDPEWVRLRQYGSQFNTGIPVSMQSQFLTGLHARVDVERIYAASLHLADGIENCVRKIDDWLPTKGPAFQVAIDTPAGRVEIGGWGPNHYNRDCLLLVDFGGNDTHETSAGGTLYTPMKVSVCLDFAGDDIYRTETGLGQGSGMYGVGCLVDCSGDDVYESKNVSQGSGHVGVGILWDLEGDDRYVARSMSQGAGFQGIGLLVDRGGRDVYRVGISGQGYGGVQGCGLLLDRAGNDSYRAGGLTPDQPREPDRFLSMAQGFGMGIRSDNLSQCASGGIGILADVTGDDSYEADVFGQGAAYWYAIGVLLDGAGRDFYEVHNYGQGAGFHMAVGVHVDFGGNDRYVGRGHALGHALDRSLGFFADLNGNDRYESADGESQGGAVKPHALAIFADLRGDDTYRGGGNGYVRKPAEGKEEEWPKAFFFDGGGRDIYPLSAVSGAENGTEWTRNRQGWGRDK